eukprot:INCI9511.1.p2 GENE.INCI9511.1~~INCI9511.1.p2  ORF type:complete len:324 (+),score=48.39 INCI9511.1:98-1069(+)
MNKWTWRCVVCTLALLLVDLVVSQTWQELASKKCTFQSTPEGILFIHFHIPKSGGSTIERLHKWFCKPNTAGEKCLFSPKLSHWQFHSIDKHIATGKADFLEKFGHEPGCVQIVTELRDPVYRTQSAFYAARARRAFAKNASTLKPPCSHISCKDEAAIEMMDNYNVSFADALLGGMNYQHNLLSFYTGPMSAEQAAEFYGNISFVFRTHKLSTDIQLFGEEYGFNLGAEHQFSSDFLDHSKTCRSLWSEPPLGERQVMPIRDQNKKDEVIYQAGMRVWDSRWAALEELHHDHLAKFKYTCSAELAGSKCGSRGTNNCVLTLS